jgi:hypothetical protein
MSAATLVNSAGLIIDIIGALMIFLNSPKLEAMSWIGEYSEKEFKETNRKNKFARWGMIVISVGFTLQLISNFIR